MKKGSKKPRAVALVLRDDYIDWSMLPLMFVAVAIDAVDTGHWRAGVPIAYSEEPTFQGGRWVRPCSDDMTEPRYVPDKSIIGPLPEASLSLRRRPV